MIFTCLTFLSFLPSFFTVFFERNLKTTDVVTAIKFQRNTAQPQGTSTWSSCRWESEQTRNPGNANAFSGCGLFPQTRHGRTSLRACTHLPFSPAQAGLPETMSRRHHRNVLIWLWFKNLLLTKCSCVCLFNQLQLMFVKRQARFSFNVKTLYTDLRPW